MGLPFYVRLLLRRIGCRIGCLWTNLDLRLAAPSAAGGGSVSRGNGVTLDFVEDIDAEQSASKPEASRDKGEGLSGLPLGANI